jgi:hypothetical protein
MNSLSLWGRVACVLASATVLVAGLPPPAVATTVDASGFMPRVGGTTTNQAFFTAECPSTDRYLVGIRGGTTLEVQGLTPGVGGVRSLKILCARVLEDGELTAPFEVGEVIGDPTGGGLPTVLPPQYFVTCGLRDGNGVVQRPGVVHGLAARLRTGHDGYLRVLDLQCAFADDLDPMLGDVGTPSSPFHTAPNPDVSQTCPAGQAAIGLRVGLNQAAFNQNITTIQMRCRNYPLPAQAPYALRPGEFSVVDAGDDRALFTWRRPAATYEVCVTILSDRRCAFHASPPVRVRDFVGSGDIGRRLTWSVRGCNVRGTATAPPRACGPASQVPFPGSVDRAAIGVAPSRPEALPMGFPVRLNANRELNFNLRWRGGPLTRRYVIRTTGGDLGPTEQRVDEPDVAGGERNLDVTIHLPRFMRGPVQLVTTSVQACAGDLEPAGREICGTVVELVRRVVDREGDVCSALPKRDGGPGRCSP